MAERYWGLSGIKTVLPNIRSAKGPIPIIPANPPDNKIELLSILPKSTLACVNI